MTGFEDAKLLKKKIESLSNSVEYNFGLHLRLVQNAVNTRHCVTLVKIMLI